ncbi:hypothetical protein [Streptomyces sp. Caat 7-52]|uniref:hypothetical protein n=1 Tax=Streptomyces sp. Caat 7-52 TaxID=2949637 RepID=UPI002035A83C|nr:hypothetical protein [Streptomyces sp. Caat 7-52]
MRKLLPLALTGLLAVSACQFGDDDAGDEAHRLNTMKAFPLQAYIPDPASGDGKAVGAAQWILARQCMVRLGFTGFKTLDLRTVESTYPVRQGTLSSRSKVGDDSPYGVDDPDLAAEHGYHNRQRLDEESTDQPMEWPADQYTALTGVFESGDSHQAHGSPIPRGGCLGQANRKIYGPEPEPVKIGGVKLSGYYSVAMKLWSDAREQAKKDPAWKKADRAWADCMKDEGFHYPDPDEASLDTHWFGADEPSGKEKKTAAADARCKLDTDYIQSVHAVESSRQKTAIARNKKVLEERRVANEKAVANARKIVADAR